MLKIEKMMLSALENGGAWVHGNTSVCGNAISLHGNHIATIREGRCIVNLDTLRRWPTKTTKSRLTALGVIVTTKNGAIYVDGVKI